MVSEIFYCLTLLSLINTTDWKLDINVRIAFRDLKSSTKYIHREKQRGCPLLGANKYRHIYIKYIYYLGVCSVELKSIIPPKALFVRNMRFSNAQHPFAVKLDKNRASAFANSFIPMTSRDRNSLPATVFSATYNLQLFKTRIHRYLRLLSCP